MNLTNVIEEAKRQSKKANWIFNLGAVVFNKDRIISAGYNRTFSQGHGYSKNGACAELLAIQKAPAALLKGASIVVVRVRQSGTVGIAKPCYRCQKIIEKSGIKTLYYSDRNGKIVKESVR